MNIEDIVNVLISVLAGTGGGIIAYVIFKYISAVM